MIIPYSHQEALIQHPVPYEYEGNEIILYPITLGDLIAFNRVLRQAYLNQFDTQIKELSRKDAEDLLVEYYKLAEDITLDSEKGQEFMYSNEDLLIEYIRCLSRHNKRWTKERIKNTFLKHGITQKLVETLVEMRLAVTRTTPPSPKLNVAEKKPRYEPTQEEKEARLFKLLADKFGWGYEEVMKLTDYQVFWYTHLFPEEREHIEELEEMTNKNKRQMPLLGQRPDVAYQPGTLHFNSPEEYEAWKATRNVKK